MSTQSIMSTWDLGLLIALCFNAETGNKWVKMCAAVNKPKSNAGFVKIL